MREPWGHLLTFKATISHGLSQGWIELFEVPDWESRMALRSLYVTPGFWTWVDGTAELHEPLKALGSRSIFEQIELMLIDFRCADRPPGASELRRMIPTKHGVWKAHPPGARLFGWVPEPGSLVIVSGEREAIIKTNRPLYEQHLKGVMDFQKLHGLESWIVRGDYRAIFPA